MKNSKQSNDFITWLNIDGVTQWTEPAIKTKLKELFDQAIKQAVEERESKMVNYIEYMWSKNSAGEDIKAYILKGKK